MVYFDLYIGVKVVVVEVVRNFSCVGVEFVVVIDNFNFGSLEKFVGYW